MKIATPCKKLPPAFPATPSKGWGPVKPPLFENLVGGSTPCRKGGVPTMSIYSIWFLEHLCKIMIYLCSFFIFQFFQQFFQIFWVVRVEGGGVKMVKMAQNYKILSVVFYISRTVHHIWLSIMIHICKVIISPDICFHFFKKKFFLLVRRIKRQKMAQNYKILSVVFYISRTVHHIWLSIMIHICKMIISPGIFFIFSKILFFCLLGGSKGKKWPKILKNSVHHALYLRNHISYDLHLRYKCVKG